jgi:hypothetical protein
MSKTYSLDEIAPDNVLRALFSTISYRLEPDGWGTRFPAVLDYLYEGSLDASRTDQALTELDQIEAQLRCLPPRRVVWSLDDLRVRNDSKQPVNHSAKNIYDYFVARDGTPLLNKLREIAMECRSQGQTIRVDSRIRRKTRWKVRLMFAGCVLLGIGLIASNWYELINEHSYYPKEAMAGPVLVFVGLVGSFTPADNRRRPVLYWALVLIGVALGLANLYWMDHYFG